MEIKDFANCRRADVQAVGRHDDGAKNVQGFPLVGLTNIKTSNPRRIYIDISISYYKIYIVVGQYEMWNHMHKCYINIMVSSRYGYFVRLMYYVTTFSKCSTVQSTCIKTHNRIYDVLP